MPPPDERNDSGAEYRVAWFWLPLPHALPLPDRWILREQVDPHLLVGDDQRAPFRSSIIVYQRTRTRPHLTDDALAIMELAAQSIDGNFDETADAQPDFTDAPPKTMTIVEVAVPARDPDFEGDTELADAIIAVQALQRAVALVTQDPVELVRSTTLPFLIPFSYGTVREGGRRPEFDGMSMLLNTESNPDTLAPRTDTLEGNKLEAVRATAGRLASGEAFATYVDLRREGLVQRSHRGNERLTVVLAAAAGEVLLDTMLLHLLWEEKVEPTEAALCFPREKSALLRSIGHLSPRLGGNWHRDGRGAVASYAKDVVEMRNRVMHAGHNPSPADAALAWSSLMDLERFLGDRLCSDRCFRLHPRTAYAWLGEDGLRRRDRWVRRITRLLDDPREPSWLQGFALWRTLVDRELAPSPERPGTSGETEFYFELDTRTGSERWVSYDPPTQQAAEFDPQSIVPDKMRASLGAMRDRNDLETAPEVVRTRLLLDPATRLPGGTTWQAAPSLLPGLDYFPGPSKQAGRAAPTSTEPPPGRLT